jgi:hypothetical protein
VLPVIPRGSAHQPPLDAVLQALFVAGGPHYGLGDPSALRSVLRIVRTTGRNCERRTIHRDPFDSCFLTGGLLGCGPTAGGRIPVRSRRISFGLRAPPNNDSHSTEDPVGRDRKRTLSLAAARGGHGEPIVGNAEGNLPHSVPQSGHLRQRSHQGQLEAALGYEDHRRAGSCRWILIGIAGSLEQTKGCMTRSLH